MDGLGALNLRPLRNTLPICDVLNLQVQVFEGLCMLASGPTGAWTGWLNTTTVGDLNTNPYPQRDFAAGVFDPNQGNLTLDYSTLGWGNGRRQRFTLAVVVKGSVTALYLVVISTKASFLPCYSSCPSWHPPP